MIVIFIICLQGLVDVDCIELSPLVSRAIWVVEVADDAKHIGERLAAELGEDEIVSIWPTCLVPAMAA